MADTLSKVRATGRNHDLDVRETIGAAKRDLELRLVYLDPSRILCVIRDMTRQREIERRKDGFLSVASHELRSPLTGISGCLDFALTEFPGLDEDLVSWLTMARDTNHHLLALVERLLQVQKIENGRQPFDKARVEVGDFLKSAELSFRGLTAGTGIPVNITDHGSGLHVWADPCALRQVLDNMVSNAVKHSPKGQVVEISAQAHDQWVRFSVKDYGPGIPEEFREEIFNRFVQVPGDSTEKKGTGLGLNIAKAIVEEHSGSISVDSRPGRYTVFHVNLPALLHDSLDFRPGDSQ